MTFEQVRRQFEQIGARVRVGEWADDGRPIFRVGMDRTERHERFQITGRRAAVDVLDVHPRLRQLLIVGAWNDTNGEGRESRYLCGFDERHWFAAALQPAESRGVRTVVDARDALKPLAVRSAEAAWRTGASPAPSGPGILRQGEWFFVPRPDLAIDTRLAQRDVPLQRSVGKPHVVRYLIGDPRSIARAPFWASRSTFPVFARGTVRHRDHKPLKLPFWHQVEMSLEDGLTIGYD